MTSEPLGLNGTYEVEPDEVVSLLRLTLSETLQREAAQKIKPGILERHSPVLFEVRAGSRDAFNKLQQGSRN